MARTTAPEPTGDTPAQIEDKVRALPANQGLNEDEMWHRIDAEIAAAESDGSLKLNESLPTSLSRQAAQPQRTK